MGTPINSSPYGVSRLQNSGSPNQGGQPQSGNPGTGGGFMQYLSPGYSAYNNRNNGGIGQSIWQGLFGKPEQNYQQSTLGPEQQQAYQQLLQAIQSQGAGGAFGDSADYYRDLLSNDSQTADQMFAPELRRFREQTVPGIAEQFAGMGSGGLSSSGFRNAALSSGADLGERLGAIRAQLRQRGAEGLQNLAQSGLQRTNENIHRPETSGLIGSAVEGFSTGLGKAAGTAAFL